MRVRSSYVVITMLLVIGAFVLFAWVRMNTATGVSDAKGHDEAFLEQVRELRKSGRGSAARDGLIRAGDVESGIPNGPKLEVETTDFDMGVIDNTKPTTETMAIYNRGKSPLQILNIRTSCGCTQGELEKNGTASDGSPTTLIPPGGELPMSITVDPFRIPGFSSKKVLTLYSDDPVKPTVEVNVSAEVKPEFTLEPESLDFGTVENGKVDDATVILRQANAENLDVTGVEPGRNAVKKGDKGVEASDVTQYTLDLKKRPKDQWKSPDHPEWAIAIHLGPSLPVGAFRDTFRILTNSKRVRIFPYRVAAEVHSFYDVAPTMLSVRNAVDPGSEHVATAVVSSDTTFSVEDLKVSGDAFTVAVRDGDKPNTKFIDLGVRGNATPGLKNERVTFKVHSGDKTATHIMRAFASVKG